MSYWLCSLPVARCWYSAFAARRVSSRSTVNVWNLTASAPAATATSTRARASAGSPLWFTPASAITNVREFT